jgi:hypothetical protein
MLEMVGFRLFQIPTPVFLINLLATIDLARGILSIVEDLVG